MAGSNHVEPRTKLLNPLEVPSQPSSCRPCRKRWVNSSAGCGRRHDSPGPYQIFHDLARAFFARTVRGLLDSRPRSTLRPLRYSVIAPLALEEIMFDTTTIGKLACCLAVSLGTATVAAQQPTTAAQRKPGDLDKIRKISTLIGANIMNHTNTKIANLRDLALARRSAIVYAIVGFGGVAGVAESYTAIPYELLGVRSDDGKWAVNLDLTPDDLKSAPMIKSENYRELLDRRGSPGSTSSSSPTAPLSTIPSGRRRPISGPIKSSNASCWRRKIRNATLKNNKNQELGKVEDLLLDRADRVAFVIIGRGGVLGIGENYIPIPWSVLGIGENRENAAVTVAIDATKAKLEMAPIVKGDNYATLLALALRIRSVNTSA